MKAFVNWLAPILFLILLLFTAYGLQRSEALPFQACFAFLFLLFLYSYWKSSEIGFNRLLIIGLLCRLALLPHTPTLSDDFYRFLFDGHLLIHGINPYVYLPTEALQLISGESVPFMHKLLGEMNSASYYSIYPPLHQAFFAWAALGGESLLWNLVLLRVPLILGEIGVVFLLWKLLPLWNQQASNLLLYWFNPLVILEITGNLHFEGLVLLGLLGSLWCYKTSKPMLSASLWTFAIGIKLVPAILGAVWLRAYHPIKQKVFWITAASLSFLVLLPLFQKDVFFNFYQSFRLYQSSFEFNASIYYILRFISSFWLDYNPIGTLGPSLSILAIMGIVVFAWLKPKSMDLASAFVGTYVIYLLMQTTIHPWYIIPLFGSSLLTRLKSPLLWTYVIFLSYSAYATDPAQESTAILLVQYLPFLIFAAWEFFIKPTRTTTTL